MGNKNIHLLRCLYAPTECPQAREQLDCFLFFLQLNYSQEMPLYITEHPFGMKGMKIKFQPVR